MVTHIITTYSSTKHFKEEAEKRGLIITSAPLIGYSVTQPAPELVSLVRNMGWDDKLKLYRSPKVKASSSKTGGNEDLGGDSDTNKSPKKSPLPVSISALNADFPSVQQR